jgi:hypothetical protein
MLLQNRRPSYHDHASSRECVRVASVAISHRSSRWSRGRGDDRRSTMSWWRSSRFSAATMACGANTRRTAATASRRGSITDDTPPPRSGTSTPSRSLAARRVSAAHSQGRPEWLRKPFSRRVPQRPEARRSLRGGSSQDLRKVLQARQHVGLEPLARLLHLGVFTPRLQAARDVETGSFEPNGDVGLLRP